MFGSFFRATVVIGTIYAISPVKLDATPLPSAPQAKKGLGSAVETLTLAANPSSVAPRLLATADSGAQGQSSQDQIGDLISLGKDLCLANPGLCVDAAKALQNKAASSNPETKVQTPIKANIPQKTAEPAKSKQPDALAALIEKTVPQTAHALAKPARSF